MKPFLLVLLLPLWTVAQNRYDVIIEEIMADPSPVVGLPENEWIELKNISSTPVDLIGWRIGDATGQSGPMPTFILQPDSFVIICSANAAAALSSFGKAISVTGFPSINNNGDLLYLRNNNGQTIHALEFSSSWYNNEIKKNGGWTLEMIDTKNPCAGGSNWKASTDARGGTPGYKNTADANNPDEEAPQLKNAFIKNNQTIVLVFNEPVDSLSAATLTNYSIDNNITVTGIVTNSPLFTQAELSLQNELSKEIIYTITLTNITDCKGNQIPDGTSVKTGIPSEPVTQELVINEILFNPRPGAYDYVEIYNNSNKIADASKLYIANRNSSGAVNSATVISTTPVYIFPDEYIVITENAASLQLNYLVKNPSAVFEISSLPSFPDNIGKVVLLNHQGAIIDEVSYSDSWHFKLIQNTEGIALERINPNAPSQEAANWHSAASTAGYGTPGYINSQYKHTSFTEAIITISPKIFSPDNDGYNDIATIQYNVTEPGYVAIVTIFDVAGRPVRNLVRNSIMALSGYWNWDGLNDKGAKLPTGTYIIFTEIFNLKGEKKQFKNTIVLAVKLN